MFVMSMLDRLTDVKKSTYAKIIAVLVSVAMVLSLTNMSAFAEGDGLSGIFGGNSDVVKVAVDLDNAKIEYGDQTVTNADKTFVASAGKDLKFKASAATEDFTLDEVALVTTAENGDEVVTDLESIDGTYTIKADDVADGITIKASATEQKTAAKDSTVITDNQSGDEVTGTETTEPGTTDNGTPENGTPENGSTENGTTEEPSTETPAAGTPTAGTPEGTTSEGTPAGTVAEPTTETPAGTVVTTNVSNTVKASVNAFAKAFTANTGIQTLAAEPMADSTYTVVIGKNTTIAGNGKWNYHHEWSSSDPSVVSVSGNGSNATVTAKKIGTVTIYHSYGLWSHETFTVNVVDSTTTVYVYVKLSGADASWTPNGDGWFTIGSIEIPTSTLEKATDRDDGFYSSLDIKKTFDFNTLVRHSDNANIALDFSKIDWTASRDGQDYGLHVVGGGAAGYVDHGKEWHLDGYLDVSQKCSANVTYSYANEAGTIADKPVLPANISQQNLASGTKVEFEVPEIGGYAPEFKRGGETVTDLEKNANGKYYITIVNSDVNVEVIYHPLTYPYTVKYLEQGTNNELHAPVTVGGNLFNTPVTANAIDIAGYNKVNPTSSTINIAAGDNEITFYYTKRTDLSYEVHYYYEDVTGSVVEDESSKVISSTGTFGDKISYDTTKTTYNEKHYVLDRVEGADKTIGTDPTQNIVNVYYTIDEVTDPNNNDNGDEKGDGIPDKYQATVTYQVEGGNWSDNTGTDKTAVFTLKTKDAEGVWQDVAPAVALGSTIPTPETKTGYTGVWDQGITSETAVTGDATYTYKFTANSYAYTVKYYTESIDPNNEIQAQEGWATGDKAEFGTTAAITPAANATINEKHYVLDSTNHSVVISENADNNVINVIYAIDEVTDPNNNGNGDEPGDGIPDKYQTTIAFKVENGEWNAGGIEEKQLVVTLYDENGKYSVNGSYELVESGIPGVGEKPSVGYKKAEGWNTPAPVAHDKYQSSVKEFVYRYVEDKSQTHIASYVVKYYTDGNLARTDGQINGNGVWVNEQAFVTVNANSIDLENAFAGYVIDDERTVTANHIELDTTINGEIEQLRDALGKLQFVNDEPGTANKQFDVNIYYKAAPSVINYVTNGGTAVEPNSGTTFQQIENRTMPVTTRDGYVFAGWYENADLSGSFESMLPETYPVGGKTYYARWISASGFTKAYNGQQNPSQIYVSGIDNMSGVSIRVHKQTTNDDGAKELGEVVDNSFVNVDQTGTYAVAVSKGTSTFVIYDVPVVITPAPITIAANDDSKMFGEEDNASYNGSVVQGIVYPNDEIGTVTYQRTNAEVNDAGYYEDVVVPSVAKADQNNNYSYTFVNGNYTIRPADSNNVAAESITKTYDAQEAAVSGQAAIEGSAIEYSMDGVNYTSESPRFANVGAYTVYVRATLDNYEPVTTTARVVINPASVTVTVNDATKTVATDDPEFTAEVEGLFGDDAIDYTIARPGAGTDEAVGVYQGALVAAGETAQGNYVVNFVPGDFTITAAAPVPVPGDGGTPTPAPAGPVPGVAPAALAPVAAALAAPVAALIGDEPTPLAEEAIGDEEDPLAAFDHVNCWVHYYMILGILLTLVYGGCVIARRSNYSRKIQKMDDYATGKAMDTVEETENVANTAAQKMEA